MGKKRFFFQVVLPLDLRMRITHDAEQNSESMATIIRLRLRERYREIDAAKSTGVDSCVEDGYGSSREGVW
jgi:hypothetical protein